MEDEPNIDLPPMDEADQVAPVAATETCSLPAVPVPGQFGAMCWAGQAWPYGKTTPVFAVGGGQRNAWGDLTHPPGSYLSTHSLEQFEQANAERAACCMPLLTPTS